MERFQPSGFAFLLLGIGFVASALAGYLADQGGKSYDAARFEAITTQIEDSIRFRMQAYINALTQAKVFVTASSEVDRESFKTYVDSTRLLEQYPGIQGLGFALIVQPQELKNHIRRIRKSGFPNYKIWPETKRDIYSSIIYLEPFNWRNQRAFGYDMLTESVRRTAMERARDTGMAVASGRVTLVQETEAGQQPGFLIYVPVYKRGVPVRNVEERRKALVGFVYSPFRTYDLFRGLFRREGAPQWQSDFEIFDGSEIRENTLLYDYDERLDALAKLRTATLKKQITIDMVGRKWSIFFHPISGFSQSVTRYLPVTVIIVSILLSVLLFGLRLTSERERWIRKKAENIGRRSAFLANASAVLVESLDLKVTLEKVAQLAIRELATWCSVDIVQGWEGWEKEESRIDLQQIAVSHKDPMQAKLFQEMRRRYPPYRNAVHGPANVIRTRKSEYLPKVSDEMFREYAQTSSSDSELLRLLRSFNLKSYIGVPLVIRDKVLGAISLFSSERQFSKEDLEMAEELARRVALAVDNSYLFVSAKNAVQIRDEFISIASHELRTPITSLKLQLELGLRQLRRRRDEAIAPEQTEKTIEIAENSVNRLNRLVEDLLDVSRITGGKLRFERSEVDLAEIIREVVVRYARQLEQVRCPVQMQLEENVRGHWDRIRIEQVVINLLSNAMKYGPGKPIRIRATRKNGSAIFSIRDQGSGIARHDQERIFRRFERATASKTIGGLGLGLYIVRMIIDAHGGTVRVESEPGEGAEFIVQLPIRGAVPAAPLAPQTPATKVS